MSWLAADNALLISAALPLVGFLLLAFFGRRMGRGLGAGVVSTVFSFLSFSAAVAGLVLWVARESFNQQHYVIAHTFRWVGAGDSHLTAGILVDSLAIALFVMLTFMGVMAHLFALGTLPVGAPRPRHSGFYARLQLLHFGVLGFLLANSLTQLFAFWELIAVAIFFLLRADPGQPLPASPPSALRFWSMHAIGSAAFLAGIGLFLYYTQSLSALTLLDDSGESILVQAVRERLSDSSSDFLFYTGVGFLGMHWLTWVGICFLVAALARMAQFPLFHWVHSAAEAPAPVTALLLGSTSLATGTFLLARIFPIFTLDARFIAAAVGCVTLAAGALVALTQRDLRKVLAWSTVSQGGFVLLFLGAGGYTAGILHLFTHAFVKTALFLAAGGLVFRLGTADLRQMGGLWRRFPITAAASLFAVLALAGAPWLSGAYSTNLGLACVYDYAEALSVRTHGHSMLLFWAPVVITYLTAAGIGRWWWLIFMGETRNARLLEKESESGFASLPVLVLAGFSVGGWFEFSGILPLISKSIPASLGRPGAAGFVISEYPYYARVITITAGASVAMGIGVAFSASRRLRRAMNRVPGMAFVGYWIEQRFFFHELFESALLPMLFFAARIVAATERVIDVLLSLAGFLAATPLRLIGSIERPAPPPAAGGETPKPDAAN